MQNILRQYSIEVTKSLIVGFAFDKLRMYNDAINDYSKALDLDNKNAFAYYNVMMKLYFSERYFIR